MLAWNPEKEEVHQFLRAVSDPNSRPVFVHCLHGADRTGTMTAVWRMVFGDWNRQKAIEEMTRGPFGFHEIFEELPNFLNDLDLDALRQQYRRDNPPKSPKSI